jgi:fused signal recognition particle receptor
MAKKGWFSWFGKGKHTEDKEETSVAGEISDKTNTDAVSTAEKQDDVLQSNNAESLSKDKIETDKLSEGAEKEPAVEELSQPEEVLPVPQEKPGFFKRLVNGLRKTRENLGLGIKALFKGRKIDNDLFEELESTLISADIGIETTEKLIEKLTAEASLKELKDADSLVSRLNADLHEILKKVSVPLVIDTSKKPFVILMVGVNGVGKTTTIGKMAKFFEAQGHKVMLAAGDTFRAAAVEQLKVWGQRNGIPVVAQSTGADSASVIFDALSSAKAKGYDILIADTAGRLQNKANLMAELQKIVRVMQKIDPEAPHEVMLTVDAGTGQNAISQVKLFGEVVPITGINITKLDGTAKGGVIFNIADNFGIPIRFIGVGEGIDDLRVFDADDFVKALFDEE